MTIFRAAGRLLAAAVSALQAALAPWLDLAIRVWLAQAFLALQVDEMMLGGAMLLSEGSIESQAFFEV